MYGFAQNFLSCILPRVTSHWTLGLMNLKIRRQTDAAATFSNVVREAHLSWKNDGGSLMALAGTMKRTLFKGYTIHTWLEAIGRVGTDECSVSKHSSN